MLQQHQSSCAGRGEERIALSFDQFGIICGLFVICLFPLIQQVSEEIMLLFFIFNKAVATIFVSIEKTSIHILNEKRVGEGCKKSLGAKKKRGKNRSTEPSMSAKKKGVVVVLLLFSNDEVC